MKRCEAMRKGHYSTVRKINKVQCRNKAFINFQGKFLCRRHAEVEALTLVLVEKSDIACV